MNKSDPMCLRQDAGFSRGDSSRCETTINFPNNVVERKNTKKILQGFGFYFVCNEEKFSGLES